MMDMERDRWTIGDVGAKKRGNHRDLHDHVALVGMICLLTKI